MEPEAQSLLLSRAGAERVLARRTPGTPRQLTQRDVLAQYLIEATTLATIGGAVGVALGIGSALTIARVAGWPSVVSIETILIAVGVSGLIGVFFGFYPARPAARRDPIEALRRA